MIFPGVVTSLLLVGLNFEGSSARTRILEEASTNASDLFKTKHDNLRILQEPIAVTKGPTSEARKSEVDIRDESSAKFARRNFIESSTFNPDVLNRFLEEYATRVKSTTDRNFRYPFRGVSAPLETDVLVLHETSSEQAATLDAEEVVPGDNGINSTMMETVSHGDFFMVSGCVHNSGKFQLNGDLNDTLERNKYWGSTSHEDRNGWVTLDAIPWSKSKISKWQSNPSTQRPWPEIKPWEKPGGEKPWPSDYSSRPGPSYESNKPWYDKPKPHWAESYEKPWQSQERPRPGQASRPGSFSDKFDQPSVQTQKWPPERPWDREPYKPGTDIITDDRPSNFPASWERPRPSRPSYGYDRYGEKPRPEEANDWDFQHEFPSKVDHPTERPTNYPSLDRPHFSQYQYSNDRPSHPSSGDGQWVLLSTNRGYSKSRQRSIKIEASPMDPVKVERASLPLSTLKNTMKETTEPEVPVLTSRRQVRLTVLPSVNGTNTTTSHGGLLEVERTFKTVDQSQREYEREKLTADEQTTILKKRPIRNTILRHPSNSAVLAAVSAGMLPATMAMMIPMVLGRRKRDLRLTLKNPLDLDRLRQRIALPM
ncbi:uncharacterized protein LOC105701965 [Orussus abietinus]|uniref:uncharacterized protein LOC105701965 n=1 Tax=Orussus abietinus TaxID=222816 RepID=UPI000C715D36|nr:uncharacterized protein LOC105701965 [Orussus abietinus]